MDVGICSPDSGTAGVDCCESMWKEKRKHYEDHLEAMERVGLRYYPIVFSCYGRVHVGAVTSLELVAKQAARRMGVSNYQPMLRRAHVAFGVAIWRRAVAMVRACLPTLSDESLNLAFGDALSLETIDGTARRGTAISPVRTVPLGMRIVEKDIPGRRVNLQAPRPGV